MGILITLDDSCALLLLKTTFPFSPSLKNLPLRYHNSSSLSFSICNQTQIPNLITCARNSRRRSGYQRRTKWVLKSLLFVASNLNILPEPLALTIAALAGGNGGGIEFPNGFGTGGFDGRRRKGKNKLRFLGFVIICAIAIAMWLVLGKDFDSDAFLALSLLGVSIKGWKRGFKDWVLGFCFCASLVCLGFRREKLHSVYDVEKLLTFFLCQEIAESGKGFCSDGSNKEEEMKKGNGGGKC